MSIHEPTPRRGPRITPSDVAALWSDVLGVEQIGDGDDFFELGGNSITAIRLLPLAQERFGVELDVGFVFDHPTLSEFAAGLGRATSPEVAG